MVRVRRGRDALSVDHGLFNCVHPPGGATALTAVLTPQEWTFIFAPVTVGVIFLVIVAHLTNKACERLEAKPTDKD
jgi:CBS-domain-containing membrane protein